MSRSLTLLAAAALVLAGLVDGVRGESPPPSPAPAPRMDNARLGRLVERIDPQAEGGPGAWQLTLRERQVFVITDERADRMRILAGVANTEGIPPELLYRLLQANFDTALDARYAIARDVVWSAFLHPLGALGEEEFVSGLAQVVTLAETFGSTFSSGGPTFGGGDSHELLQELRDRLNAI